MSKDTEKKELELELADQLAAAKASADAAAKAAVDEINAEEAKAAALGVEAEKAKAEAEAAALAVKKEKDWAKAEPKLAKAAKAVALRAVHSSIRNPVTGQMFNVNGPATTIMNIEAPAERWTKLQVKAGILIEVKE